MPDYATLLAEYSESNDKLFRLEWESGENEFYIAKLEKEMETPCKTS